MNKKFIFIGNRFFVLEQMLRLGLHFVKIMAVKGSYLQKELENRNIAFTLIQSKQQLVDEIKNCNFDIFFSNGCPFILPIDELKVGNKQFINIHPSFLPDLRGADPQPGALLFGKDSGVTCHVMDDGIDTGEIIAQVKIPYSRDLDAALLYQISFMAEIEVFYKAYENNFEVQTTQVLKGDEIYYSKKDNDLIIDFNQSAEIIYQKIKAFSNRSQGAYFIFEGRKYKVYDCEIVDNDYLISKFDRCQNGEVALNYENKLLIKVEDKLLKFKDFNNDILSFKAGMVLENKNEVDKKRLNI